MNDQKNLIVAIVPSVAILVGFQLLYQGPKEAAHQAELARQKALNEETLAPAAPAAQPGTEVDAPAAPAAGPAVKDRPDALAAQPRLRINTSSLHGSIRLTGSRFDDLTLANYRVTPDRTSPEVILLSPSEAKDGFYAELGWVPGEGTGPVPDNLTAWEASGDVLTPSQPVHLTWNNGKGLTFEREIQVDDKFLFTITDRVKNDGETAATLYPFGLVRRAGAVPASSGYVLTEGPLGVFNGVVKNYTYQAVAKEGRIPFESTGGWLGITDKYWLVSVIPDQKEHVSATLQHMQRNGADTWQTDFRGDAVQLAPGATTEKSYRLFAGAKEARQLDAYEEQYNIPQFDNAIDWGWYYFLTKRFFYALDYLAKLSGSFWMAIILFTVVLRLFFFPIANKQFASFAKMRRLQPQMAALKERHKDDPPRFQTEMMALYKKEKVNPLAGCLPIVVQIPVFYALYKVLYVTIEMRHAPFVGWIKDLSAPDPTHLFNLFGLLPFTPPNFLHIGLLPIIMGLTMFAQQKLSPANPDPVQQRIFLLMPVIFTFMMAGFPAGLVLYWTWSNLLVIGQQWFIMRRYDRLATAGKA